MDNIIETYNIPYKLADVITWYWSGSEDNYGYLHQQIINDVVYIMSRDKYFDISTNEEYKKEAIDFKYARYF